MKSKILGLVAVGLLATLPVQIASAITLSAGQTATFNFDLTGASPSPPFDSVTILTYVTNFTAGDQASGTCFGGLNGTGQAVSSGSCFANISITFLRSLPNFVDGLFSWVVTATAGSFDVNPCASGQSATAATACIAGNIPSVPEPGTLALLGLGLAGLGLSPRRKA